MLQRFLKDNWAGGLCPRVDNAMELHQNPNPRKELEFLELKVGHRSHDQHRATSKRPLSEVSNIMFRHLLNTDLSKSGPISPVTVEPVVFGDKTGFHPL